MALGFNRRIRGVVVADPRFGYVKADPRFGYIRRASFGAFGDDSGSADDQYTTPPDVPASGDDSSDSSDSSDSNGSDSGLDWNSLLNTGLNVAGDVGVALIQGGGGGRPPVIQQGGASEQGGVSGGGSGSSAGGSPAKSNNTGLYIGLGIAALAGLYLFMPKKRAA